MFRKLHVLALGLLGLVPPGGVAACSDDSATTSDAGPDVLLDRTSLPDVPSDRALADVLPDTATPDRLSDGSVDAASPCGNGTLDPGEVCDDGNNISGDGCNATCTLRDDQDLPANGYGAGDQYQVSASAHGDTVVAAWLNRPPSAQPLVWFRQWNHDGRPLTNYQGNEFEVAVSQPDAPASEPDVAACPDGLAVVTWASGDPGSRRIHAAVLGPQSETVVGDIAVDSDLGPDADQPTVACGGATFLVAWHHDGGIQARLFDHAGNPVANDQTGTDGSFQIVGTGASEPDSAWLDGVGWVLVWTQSGASHDGSGTGISGILLSPSGAQTASIPVNSTTNGNQSQPVVAAQTGVGFVVAWTDASGVDDTSFTGIRMRLFDATGQPRVNAETGSDGDAPVNTYTTGRQEKPAIAVLGDRLYVAWQDGSGSDGSFAGIRGRLFRGDGHLVLNPWTGGTDDVRVNTNTRDAQLAPAAAATSDVFFVFWEDLGGPAPDGDGKAVRFRLVPPAV